MSVLRHSARALLVAMISIAAGCGGGSRSEQPGTAEPPTTNADQGCDGSCATANSRLSAANVQQVIAQAAAEANAQGMPATIAVVDRVGNVLGLFQMNGAPGSTTIRSGKGAIGGLEEIAVIPSTMSAVAKAVTGAYLSSEGNGFTTRTASQIVQEHFNPGEIGQPGGPLFGVQFSQLPCSDFSLRFTGAVDAGPKRSPLGLSADPGGMPLYIDGVPVGGIGIESDGLYTLDPVVSDKDLAPDELIAVAGSFGFASPNDRKADRITVDGKTFRFSDALPSDLATDPGGAAPFSSIDGALGQMVPLTGYFDGMVQGGTAFGFAGSGVQPDQLDYPGLDAFVLVDADGNERFRPIAGTDGANALTENEVRVLVQEALKIANAARAQIRRPVGSQARVSISVVDTNGTILAIARTRDAPIFGLDVSLQKARTASFYSGAFAGNDLRSAADANYINSDGSAVIETIRIGQYVDDTQAFLGSNTALDDGAFAFADRSGGNLSRPFFPDGAVGTNPGPFSKPFDRWSPFNVGLQLDLVYNSIIGHVLFVLGAAAEDVPPNCTNLNRLGNGIQIFPGSVPIYRGGTLVGGIGVSGDGIDQDDMISFLGLHNAGEILGSINNADPAIRADQLTPQGVRLRYIQCPQSPFLDSDEQNVCEGK
ncbi:MAG: heme-binding protein [Xanthomonadales bacterium]|nr:heme-binding protein [Xanthomonadales bacterium]